MERFVRFIVAGGLALVAGLWVAAGFGPGTTPWLVGVAVAVLGCGALAVGIYGPLEV